MRKPFQFNVKTLVAIVLGSVLFGILFLYVKIPTGIPDTQIQMAYGIGGFFAALFGPVAGGLIAFIGHAVSDSIQYRTPYWSWVAASGVSCFIVGLVQNKLQVREGKFEIKDVLIYNSVQIVANIVSFVIVAPVLDIIFYKESIDLVSTQSVVAAIFNTISMGVIGSILLWIYSKVQSFLSRS